MKRLTILAAALLLGIVPARSQSLDRLWDEANTAYINADYQAAIATYDSILATGNVSYKVYYNLGNAYFKEGKIGPSILNYNPALRLAPSDADIDYNLRVANSYVKDKIEHVPEFFLATWFRSLRMSLSSNAWASVSLVLLAALLGCVLLYLLSTKLALRKTGFYSAIVLLLLFIFSVVSASIGRRELTCAEEAIVMNSAAPVKSSPDNGSKDLFVLHEGTKVSVLNSLEEWREIAIADGNKGWIRSSAIELIQ